MLRRACQLIATVGLLGSTGCGLLCDRYCDRQHDHCGCNSRPSNCCNSSPVDSCAPAAGNTYYANPNCR